MNAKQTTVAMLSAKLDQVRKIMGGQTADLPAHAANAVRQPDMGIRRQTLLALAAAAILEAEKIEEEANAADAAMEAKCQAMLAEAAKLDAVDGR